MLVLSVPKAVRFDHLAFAPDGRVLVGCSDFGAYLWRDLTADNQPEHIAPNSIVTFARFTPDGRYLFLADDTNVVRFDPQSGRADAVKLWHDRHCNIQFDLSPDGTRLIVAQWFSGPPRSSEMHVKCLPTGDLTAKPSWERDVPSTYQNGPLFLSDGERFVWWEYQWVSERQRCEFYINTYSAATGADLSRSEGFAEVLDVSISILSPDARLLAGRYQRHLYVWELEPRPKFVAHITNDSKKHFTGMAFHPSGKFVALTSNDKTVKLYDTATWQPAHTFAWNVGKLRSVCFSSDGTLAAAGSDAGNVVIWDVDL